MSLLRNHEVHSQSVERFAVIVYGKTHFPLPPSLCFIPYIPILQKCIMSQKKRHRDDSGAGWWVGWKKGKFRNLKGAFLSLSFSVEMMILLLLCMQQGPRPIFAFSRKLLIMGLYGKRIMVRITERVNENIQRRLEDAQNLTKALNLYNNE